MKKIQLIGLTASVLAFAFTSCNGGSGSNNASLKTQNDTTSYAAGVKLADGLPAYLVQMGVLKDTVELSRKLAMTSDASLKAKK